MAAPKLTLYTNLGCPWANRAHIALKELGLEYETVIIDISVPRTPEYLAINPRGLVPSLKYNDEIITESAIVVQFLTDTFPSHLVKTSSEPGGALQRARFGYFVDTFFSKFTPFYQKAMWLTDAEEKSSATQSAVDAAVKDLEPLLKDAKPFFGGNERLTLAEVLTGPFLLRLLSFPKFGLLQPSFLTSLEEKAPSFWAWANAVVKENSVNHFYDEELVGEATRRKIAQLSAAK